MRGDYIALGVVGRMLHGAKIGDIHILRDNDKAAGVLTCRALNADKPLCKAVFLRLCNLELALLEILFYISVGGLFRQRAYRAGTENMVRAEKLFCIFMRLCLIFAGEVKVNIRSEEPSCRERV